MFKSFAPLLKSAATPSGGPSTPRQGPVHHAGKRPTPKWFVAVDPHTVEVEAWTRGEARAAAKASLGIKGRLPVGTRINRDANPDSYPAP